MRWPKTEHLPICILCRPKLSLLVQGKAFTKKRFYRILLRRTEIAVAILHRVGAAGHSYMLDYYNEARDASGLAWRPRPPSAARRDCSVSQLIAHLQGDPPQQAHLVAFCTDIGISPTRSATDGVHHLADAVFGAQSSAARVDSGGINFPNFSGVRPDAGWPLPLAVGFIHGG